MCVKLYERLKNYSELLNDENIKPIIKEMTCGHTLYDMKRVDNKIVVSFKNKNYQNVYLELTHENLIFIKHNRYELEKQVIVKGPIVKSVHYELRPTGIIITKLSKNYEYTRDSKREKYITDLYSKRYVISNNTISNLFNENPCMFGRNIVDFYKKIEDFERIDSIEKHADLTTKFETHMRSFYKQDGKWIPDSYYSTRTYLNGEDISVLYNSVSGRDQLLRIYDLYNGIINERNEIDIYKIHHGDAYDETFGLKEYKGITSHENMIASKSLIRPSKDYYEYINKFFKNFNSNTEEIYFLDRNTLLQHIKQQKEKQKVKM